MDMPFGGVNEKRANLGRNLPTNGSAGWKDGFLFSAVHITFGGCAGKTARPGPVIFLKYGALKSFDRINEPG
jgi:hypothetical protein